MINTYKCSHTNKSIINDGIKYNIEDARLFLCQIEQYLHCIYKLLLTALDQIIKISNATYTIGEYDSTKESVILLLKEIDITVNNANYNGRRLLSKMNENISIIFRLSRGNRAIGRALPNNIYNDFTVDLPKVDTQALGIDAYINNFEIILDIDAPIL